MRPVSSAFLLLGIQKEHTLLRLHKTLCVASQETQQLIINTKVAEEVTIYVFQNRQHTGDNTLTATRIGRGYLVQSIMKEKVIRYIVVRLRAPSATCHRDPLL